MKRYFLENIEDDTEQTLKRIDFEYPIEDQQNSTKHSCITEFIQELNSNKKLVIGVSIFLLGMALN